LYRNGKQATVFVKVLGEYTQRDMGDADKGFFSNMVELSPTYQAITSGEPGHSVGRAVTITRVVAEELGGIKGKRLVGTGYPPLPGFELVSPVSFFFADDTGLLRQATYDLKAIMQGQIDRSRAMNPGSPAVKLEEFAITSDWTEAAVDTDPLGLDPALTFTPGPSDHKVNDFNTADNEDSVQHRLIGTSAPAFAATTLAGKSISLSDVKGRVVLLQFWSSAEPASTAALTIFNSMDIVYRPKGVAFLGVNHDHATMTTQSRIIATAKGAAFPQVADPEKTITNAYRVALVPCTILIDKEGVIRSISQGFDGPAQIEIAAKLDKLLAGEPLPVTVAPAPFTPPAQLKPAKPAEPAAPATPPATPVEEPKKP
ncbi:MAG: redoxin domain-containing protein, partial [Phycisphaerales bacterium]|nr:redoxin domain-containing protein [Phycisphaerales bacterium]